MEMVDDSDGYYGKCFFDVINCMITSINCQTLTHEKKKQYISYMFTNYIKDDPDYFTEYYFSALEQICTNKHDYTYWLGLLEPHLPEKIPNHSQWSAHYCATEKILMQIYILDKLKDKSINDIFAMHYRDDYQICIQYIKHLQKIDSDKALHILEDGLKIYPKITEFKKIACNLYQNTGHPKYIDSPKYTSTSA